MSSKSWYVLKAKAVPSRYGLSRNMQTLLQGLDKYKTGSIDAAELGRLVRLSPKRRAAIADTISKCADRIKRDPEELKTCLDVIEMCTEILEIADRPAPTEGFPLMRLPIEIREYIIDLIIDNVFRSKGIGPASAKTCNCPNLERGSEWFYQTPQMKALPSALGPALNSEFFRVFFRKKCVRFRCSCEMRHHLEHNQQLLIHCGPESALAFKQLSKCPKLEGLTLGISKSTLAHLSERTNLMKSFFPLMYRNARITDALGLDELLTLRGLQQVWVQHVQFRASSLAFETERANLAELLSSRLKQPKKEIEETTDE
ncbi:hypothetical protein BGZ63DRAFT_437542 [Mariannaea sp. PMI_226]|nr:hypothetical protein BGZ63DRAFT_437542 [Mariannaea sp. PMI_226]